MSQSTLHTFRPEVQNYLRSCEHLLSLAAAPHNPFSTDELQIVNYYVSAVTKMVDQLAKV